MPNLPNIRTFSTGSSASGLVLRKGPRSSLGKRGFTLLEVMISAFVLVAALAGYLSTVVQAYRLDETARRRDQVRAVLQSFADQFNRGSVTFVDENDADKKKINAFFDPAQNTVETGFGLQWIDGNGTKWPQTPILADGPGLKFRLGSESSAPEVTITRRVWEVDEATGAPGGAATPNESTELFGEFTATWVVDRHPQTLVLRTLRCANATGVTPAASKP